MKCKRMEGTFKDMELHWYRSLPRLSIIGYLDLTMKMVQYFSSNKHRKLTTTNLFNVLQGPSESPREYTVLFNEDTIKLSHLNQEMFVGAFQNGLKVNHFNKSLAHKLATNMEEVMNREKHDVKGEEGKMEKSF